MDEPKLKWVDRQGSSEAACGEVELVAWSGEPELHEWSVAYAGGGELADGEADSREAARLAAESALRDWLARHLAELGGE